MYRWKEHVGEVELELAASNPEGVFAEALAALAELMSDGEDGDAAPSDREIEVTAGDMPALLVEWIGELAFLAEVEGLVPRAARRIELADGRLRATVEFRAGTPPHLVKAATYHRLAFERRDAGWRASVVLDV